MRHLFLAILSSSFCLSACYSEKQWQRQLDRYGQLHQELDEEQELHQQALKELEQFRERVSKAKQELQVMGVNLDQLHSELQQKGTTNEQLTQNLEELHAALEEYQKRAEQLERIKMRYDQLKEKLTALVNRGLKVEIRHNRMVIRLPGDVLFEPGQDQLRAEGKEVLDDVLAVIVADEQLQSRYFQIAGHTDSALDSDGRYGDSWALSALRAKRVLFHLMTPTDREKFLLMSRKTVAKKQGEEAPAEKETFAPKNENAGAKTDGAAENPEAPKTGLPAVQLHIAGYADTDPVSSNETEEGRATNRRVELVLLPDLEEMLDLQELL